MDKLESEGPGFSLALLLIPTVTPDKLSFSASQFSQLLIELVDPNRSLLRTGLALTSCASKTLRSRDAVALILSLLWTLEKEFGGVLIYSLVLLSSDTREHT